MKDMKNIDRLLSHGTVILVVFLLLMVASVAVYSLAYLPPFIDGEYFGVPIYLIMPYPIVMFSIMGASAYAWYALLVLVILSSLGIFLYRGLPEYRKNYAKNESERSSIQEFSELFAATTVTVFAITVLMQILGVNVHGIGLGELPLYSVILHLLHAAVFEELVVRLLFLGIPVFLYAVLVKKKDLPVWRIFGGNFSIGVVELSFILISAAIFGIAHTQSWGWWKFVPTFVVGLALGYLYMRYGIHYAILFHFLTDYSGVTGELIPSLGIAVHGMILLVEVLGVYFAVVYSLRILRHFKTIKSNPT